MRIFKTLVIAICLAFISHLGFAQVSDDINVSAKFSSSIDLKVTDGSKITFAVATLQEYTDGLEHATKYSSKFEVNSSVNFKVDLTSTAFDDGNGNILDAANFGYTLKDNGSYAAGQNHKLVGASKSPSNYAVLGKTTEIVTSNGKGNAGSAAANAYIIKFELGTAEVRKVSKLPILLEQNIAPATYSSTVTLTATGTP